MINKNRKECLLENTLPSLSRCIDPYLNSDFSGKISREIKHKIQQELNWDDKKLTLELLPIASRFSVAPVSQFHVGAVVIDIDDNIYMGANLEIRNEALFHSVHAEQTAISHAWQSGARGIRSITINTTPCGHCRQFLLELDPNENLIVHIANRPTSMLLDLMNEPFDARMLNIEQSLFQAVQQPMHLQDSDPLLEQTLKQASLSYAPYSNNFAAVGIETNDGHIFFGRYAENSAFNPSLLPMQCALAAFARSTYKLADIARAVLIETHSGKISLKNASSNALNAVTQVPLERHIAWHKHHEAIEA